MFIEVYDNYKQRVPCLHAIKVHAMSSWRVKLTFGKRLQSVYTCEDCGVSCIKLTRRANESDDNHCATFGDFICVQYDEGDATYA